MKFRDYKVVLLCLCIWCVISASAHAETKILITVDVESYSKGNPDKQIWGNVNSDEQLHGITKIMELLDARDIKGTFFLNVYEAAKHGADSLKRAAQEIHKNGHDLQLHTHPHPMFGVAQIAQAELEQQVEILKNGVNLIYEWTGKQVEAHRAGAYGANLDTLEALHRVGILVDSSFSPASNTPLSRQISATNQPLVVNGVLEIPVSYYSQAKVGSWSSLRIVDIESSTIDELQEIVRQAVEAKLPVVNIMMHSFSFVRYGVADIELENRFSQLLDFIATDQQLKAVTITGLMDDWRNGVLPTNSQDNFVPHTGFWLTYLRAVEDYDKGTINLLVAISPVVAVSVLVLFMVVWNFRKK